MIAEMEMMTMKRISSGHCGMWMTSPCYQCEAAVQPMRIVPPNPRHVGRQRRSKHIHRCNAPDCIYRQHQGLPVHVVAHGTYFRAVVPRLTPTIAIS